MRPGGATPPSCREHLLERSYAAFNAGDREGLREVWTEDLVWIMAGDVVWPGPAEYRGYDGLEQFRQDWFGAWDMPTVSRLATEHLPGDRTLVKAHATGQMQGVDFALDVWQIVGFRDGRIAKVEHYLEEHAAREAAGLA